MGKSRFILNLKSVYNWTEETLITKYNLVCDRASLNQDITTVGMAGLVLGAVGFGTLSDK